jgi:hypothetical protein
MSGLPEARYDANVANVLTGPNAIHPDWLTAEERFSEIAQIISAALARRRVRQRNHDRSAIQETAEVVAPTGGP